ncbi:hypothetical protein NA57DRAFT_79789 [Rhizodiscina lignyota]|uniref:Putative gamma-glutamylcyclotransferase n=1 Tax=Rhizodiscina lignyota TaxID=1504668 RepID=A0A9P4I894_9PEZI|nr:hypothetical protein NA57DRAFT_79789 [Rhizodiscina lignyota]
MAKDKTVPSPVQAPKVPWKPCYMFFYGSLMDSDVLRSILRIPSTPPMRTGSIPNFKMKMWSVYPTLVRHISGTVKGVLYWIDDETHFETLAQYETKAYTWCFCDVKLDDNENGNEVGVTGDVHGGEEVLKDCRVFVWAGKSDSKELEGGSFDLEHYRQHYKWRVVR